MGRGYDLMASVELLPERSLHAQIHRAAALHAEGLTADADEWWQCSSDLSALLPIVEVLLERARHPTP